MIYAAWIEGRFSLLISQEQLAELKSTLAKPKVRKHIRRAQAGELVNELGFFAVMVTKLPVVRRSPDVDDDFLLGLAEGGAADYLVTGDRGDLLSLGRHGRTRIVGASYFCKRVLKRHRGR
jgi:putative PIN family toxin of toxin-antitoxin system